MTDHSNTSDANQAKASESDSNAASVTTDADLVIRRRILRAIVSVIAGAMVIGLIQWRAPGTDYQAALLQSLAVVGIVLLIALYQLQRAAIAASRPWLVPACCLGLIGIAATLFKFESFSGEMFPRFSWRFGGTSTPAMKVTPLTEQSPKEITEDATIPTDETAASQTTWSQFLGDQRTGIVTDRQFEIPTSLDQVSRRWDIGVGEGWSSFAVFDNVAVTLEQRDERECVTAYRLSDGQLLWLIDHKASHFQALGGGGPRSTPTIVPADEEHPARVYAQGATGRLWCLNLATGEVIWQKDLLEVSGWNKEDSEAAISWGRSGSPLLTDGLCIIPLGGPDAAAEEGRSLIALDADSGDMRWRAGSQQISYASPMVMTLGGERQIVSVNEADITGHDISSGSVLWSFPWEGKSNSGANCAAAIPAGKDQFLIGKGYGGGSSLISVTRAETTNDSEEAPSFEVTELWHSSRVLKTKFNHCLVQDGIAYGISNGALQAVEVESGERLWEQSRRERCGQGQAVLIDDVLVVQSEEGEVLLVEATPDEYREILRIPALQHKTWNIPTVVGNLILVRNARQAIALELPE